jgi:hypothetical protein
MAFLMQKVGRSKSEIFKILKNGSATAITPGDAVCYDYTTAADGIAVILPTAALLGMFAGVVAVGTTLAASGTDGEYGKVQIYGHHTACKWVGSTTPIGAGLVPVNATGGMAVGTSHGASTAEAVNERFMFAWAGELTTIANSLYSATGKKAFIRAM